MTKIIALAVANLVTPNVGAKYEVRGSRAKGLGARAFRLKDLRIPGARAPNATFSF